MTARPKLFYIENYENKWKNRNKKLTLKVKYLYLKTEDFIINGNKVTVQALKYLDVLVKPNGTYEIESYIS